MAQNNQTISTAHRCPLCGFELPVHVPPELCPKCLLKAGLPDGDTPVIVVKPGESAAVHRLNPGDPFGHYRIVRLLGAGGMGAVYEADDFDSDRRVALKILSQRFDTPDARKRFLREGRLAASINHPNSVYVFGTEEIGGVPVIAMELMPGGTLEERVCREGPLDIRQAVDQVLNIIDGLQAAHAVGILHRDIKPSNCFLDADGTVKIGDFGLSISTEAHGEARVTVNTSFMGTPVFASPEQLRGDELTVRSDIYSVGVTLFYLLTGRLPHESQDMVRLLAKVLENPAPSPASYRPDIPSRLCNAVQRCLEKCPADRFNSYDELRRELARFGSSGTIPAGLAVRFLAGVLDGAIIGLPLLLVFSILPAPRNDLLNAFVGLFKMLAAMLAGVGYFALLEGRHGRTPGKALLQLRVVKDADRPAGLLRSLFRAVVFVAMPLIIVLIANPPVLETGVTTTQSSPTVFRYTVSMIINHVNYSMTIKHVNYLADWRPLNLMFWYVVTTFLLFVLASRRNGYTALHDWLTKTRVVASALPVTRPALTPADIPADAARKPMIGPFHVLDNIEGADDWMTGYDSRLLRRVWIHKVSADTPPVSRALRNLGRATRLRWIAGKRSAEENWDAYEGISGQPLLKLVDQQQSWSAVRFWLLDLAVEIEEAKKDGTLPAVLGLDRVWITGDGRAKLLDFQAPGVAAVQPPHDGNLVSTVALRCLENRPVPLPVHEFLKTAGDGNDVRELRQLLHVPVVVSRMQRLAVFAASAAGPVLVGLAAMLIKQISPALAIGIAGITAILGMAIPALLAAWFFGGGLLLRMFGVAIVRHDGRPATEAQTTMRSLLAWLPCFLSPLPVPVLMVWLNFPDACFIVLFVITGLAVMSALLPERGLPDRLAGTWLVPR